MLSKSTSRHCEEGRRPGEATQSKRMSLVLDGFSTLAMTVLFLLRVQHVQ